MTQSHHRLNGTLVNLRTEVEGAVAEHQAALEGVRSIPLDQIKLADEVRGAYVKSFQTGDRPLAEVIEARNYRSLSQLYLSSRADSLAKCQIERRRRYANRPLNQRVRFRSTDPTRQ